MRHIQRNSANLFFASFISPNQLNDVRNLVLQDKSWYEKICFKRGALGYIRNRKTEEKITQNRKTAKKFGQNRKPHTKPSKTDAMVTSGAYRAN